MDKRLQTLKPWDTVGITLGGRRVDVRVVVVTPDGLLYAEIMTGIADVFFAGPDVIVWPEPPKATPGVVYWRAVGMAGMSTEFAYGMASGKLKRDYHPDAHGNHFDFTPDWQEVPE